MLGTKLRIFYFFTPCASAIFCFSYNIHKRTAKPVRHYINMCVYVVFYEKFIFSRNEKVLFIYIVSLSIHVYLFRPFEEKKNQTEENLQQIQVKKSCCDGTFFYKINKSKRNYMEIP